MNRTVTTSLEIQQGSRQTMLATSAASARTGSSCINPQKEDYFHGRISRQDAERLLMGGRIDGLFLLRWAISQANGYAISVYFNGRAHHYAVECNSDATVSIEGGKRFPGAVELINYHRRKKAGMVTKLLQPCPRPPHVDSPYFWFGVTTNEFHSIIQREEVMQGRDVSPEDVARLLHEDQPWYHGRIERLDAERRLNGSGDGHFLVREKTDGSFVLSLSHHTVVWHYAIEYYPTPSGRRKLKIQNGPKFDNLMDLITYYHCGGLYYPLTTPCSRPGYRPKISPCVPDLERNPLYGRRASVVPVRQYPVVYPDHGFSLFRRGSAPAPETVPLTPTACTGRLSPARSMSESENYLHPSCPNMDVRFDHVIRDSEMPDVSVAEETYLPVVEGSYMPHESDADSTYFAIRRLEGNNMLDVKQDQLLIDSNDVLGSGQFGSVMKAKYRVGDACFVVAVKTLKTESPAARKTMLKEASIMAELDNRYIIRLIGLCNADNMQHMLILEYAPMGTFKDFLKKNRPSIWSVLELLQQVATGMAYLESKSIVHRDLAARNVLLLTARHAKISDFGLSRDLTFNSKDYYQPCRNNDEKWPIKWYAPECLRSRKFDSKSDVWSFGVTVWEATSYGETPFKGIDQSQYIRAVERGTRLKKPQSCPGSLYGLMLHCWAEEKSDRPTFSQIVKRLKRLTCMETLNSDGDDGSGDLSEIQDTVTKRVD